MTVAIRETMRNSVRIASAKLSAAPRRICSKAMATLVGDFARIGGERPRGEGIAGGGFGIEPDEDLRQRRRAKHRLDRRALRRSWPEPGSPAKRGERGVDRLGAGQRLGELGHAR